MAARALCALGGIVVALGSSLNDDYQGHYDGLDGVDLHWRTTASHIEIALSLSDTESGWVGFGLAEPTVGGMAGSDIVFVSMDSNGEDIIVSDRHAVGQMTPIADCSQDWEATDGVFADGRMVVHLRRLLVTEDGEDRPVQYGIDNRDRPFRVLLAHGTLSSGGQYNYHASNRVAVKLNLLNAEESLDELAALRSDPDIITFDMRPSVASSIKSAFGGRYTHDFSNVTNGLFVPENTNGGGGYIDMCFDFNDLLPPLSEKKNPAVPYHVVGFEHLLDEETSEFVHHFTVHGFYNSKSCGVDQGAFAFGWAPGVDAFATPEPAGYPIANYEAVLDHRGKRQLKKKSESSRALQQELCNVCAQAEFCYTQGCIDGEISQAALDGGCQTAVTFGCGAACFPESPCAEGKGNSGTIEGGRAFRSFRMQVHYDNPKRKTGHRDDSGIRVFMQKTPRLHDIGVLQLGDGRLSQMNQGIPKGTSQMQTECPSACTEQLDAPVHVFNTQLHAHQIGARMVTETVRNGAVVTEGSEAPRQLEYYNFGFQEGIYREWEIKPGDALRTTCTYKTDSEQKFGLGSWDEMCIDFVAYYPADPLFESGYCGAEGSCGGQVNEAIHKIDEESIVFSWPAQSSISDANKCSISNIATFREEASANFPEEAISAAFPTLPSCILSSVAFLFAAARPLYAFF